jgi:hypothetical protein
MGDIGSWEKEKGCYDRAEVLAHDTHVTKGRPGMQVKGSKSFILAWDGCRFVT